MNKRFVNSPHPHVDNFARKRSPGKGEAFLRRMAWDASGGAVRMRRRRGAICEAASAAPRAISFLSWQKRYGRKDRWRREIALTRLKSLSFRSAFSCYPVRRPNALRAAVQSGFPSARYTKQIALFAPVEYLTYGIRSVSDIKRLIGSDAPVRLTSPQNISTTTPVCQMHICIAFCKS